MRMAWLGKEGRARKRLTCLSCTAELMKTQIPLYPRCKNPETIQRNTRNLKSRCIATAKTPKTYSGIQEIPNPAVSPLQKSRKHTAEFKKSQIPLYSRCKNPETVQRNSRNPKSRCIPAAKSRKHTAEFKKTQIPLYSHCFANGVVGEARNWQRKFLRTPPFKKKSPRTCNNIQILTSIPSNQAYSCNHRRKNNKKLKNNSKCD